MLRIESAEPDRWCDSDWQRCYQLHCSAHREQASHPRSLAAYRLAHKPAPGRRPKHYWIARDGDAIVAKLDLALADSDPNQALLALYVMHEARRCGVASALLREMLGVAEQLHARSAHVGAVKPENWAVCERLGGHCVHATMQQSLTLEAANWQLARAWCDAAQRTSATRLESFERLPDELSAPFLDLEQRTWAEFPQTLRHISTTPTLAARREEERRHQLLGWYRLTLTTREPDGTLSGVTDITYDPLQPDLVHQNLTAVLQNYRGRGLAKWLKAAMLLTIHERFPAAERVLTSNADDNTPMLEINRKLGFGGAIQQRIYAFELALLRARLTKQT